MKLNQISHLRHKALLCASFLVMLSIGLTGSWMVWRLATNTAQALRCNPNTELTMPSGNYVMK
jgi:hypothetical protein